jgi:hypothetical protein
MCWGEPSFAPMGKPMRAKVIGPLKPQTIYDNIPRLVGILGE